ncbi:MAG: DUF1697 domain-containing protein [Flavobacteriales bacterium]|nr:DUF1697 domain-containing protein [Flavobacteriales bacterium]
MAALTTYLLLFRGVGGPVQLPVTQLRAALTKAGFKNVTTYINSGNALARSAVSRRRLSQGGGDLPEKFNYGGPSSLLPLRMGAVSDDLGKAEGKL